MLSCLMFTALCLTGKGTIQTSAISSHDKIAITVSNESYRPLLVWKYAPSFIVWCRIGTGRPFRLDRWAGRDLASSVIANDWMVLSPGESLTISFKLQRSPNKQESLTVAVLSPNKDKPSWASSEQYYPLFQWPTINVKRAN